MKTKACILSRLGNLISAFVFIFAASSSFAQTTFQDYSITYNVTDPQGNPIVINGQIITNKYYVQTYSGSNPIGYEADALAALDNIYQGRMPLPPGSSFRPGWTSEPTRFDYATRLGSSLGTPNLINGVSYSPYFFDTATGTDYRVSAWNGTSAVTLNVPIGTQATWAFVTQMPLGATPAAGAPEIDGSLAPKVGFLLGCLFLMFGRKKQDAEPMMAA